MKGDQSPLERLREGVRGDQFWEAYLRGAQETAIESAVLHLGVFVEPYLQYVLDGSKTVESRFSMHRLAPYQRVRHGDVLLLKRSGGPIVGLSQITDVWFYKLDPESWQAVRREFTLTLGVQDPQFWADRANASYATLMRIQHVRPLAPITYQKRDRRGWVVLETIGQRES